MGLLDNPNLGLLGDALVGFGSGMNNGGGLGGGFAGANQMMNQAQALREQQQVNAMRKMFQQTQMRQMEQNMQAKEAQAKAMEQAIGQLPPGMQAMARAFPAQFAQQMFQKQPDQFETVQNPYGRGGVGQVNKATGQIVGYQAPAKPDAPASGMVPDGKGGWMMDPAYADFQLKKTAAGKADPIQVNTGKSIEDKMVDRLDAGRGQAMEAVSTIDRLNGMADALKNANIGPGSGLKQGVERIAVTLGVAGNSAAERVANTQTLMRGLSEMTLSSRQMLKGQGQLSDMETRLLEKARSGDITEMTTQELGVVMDAAARAAEAQYKGYIDTRDRALSMPSMSPYGSFFAVPEMPKYAGSAFAKGSGQTAPIATAAPGGKVHLDGGDFKAKSDDELWSILKPR